MLAPAGVAGERGIAQPLIAGQQLGVAHADAAVLDLDQVAARHQLAGHQHCRVGRREPGGVLDQLGQQVGNVHARVARHRDRAHRQHAHARVVLDL